ncbi:Na/Pi cotransporter family protein [Bacterioplanes sanyensis]|nr:Na/Pi symporter [Bacterioplanes sanyensis]
MDVLNRWAFPIVLTLLAIALWHSSAFQEIAAGVALFLFGMLSLERGFKALSGGVLQQWLQRCTSSTAKALGVGIVSTTLMQSSSLVSVLSISFISAGLIPLTAGLGIVFGANLGTTTGAWLIAMYGLTIKLSTYALPLLVFGIALQFQHRRKWQSMGHILTGVGFVFFGIHMMKQGFSAYDSLLVLDGINSEQWSARLLFVALGILATVIMQSSHATLVLILTALANGQIDYLAALSIAIGANVGTTITALIGALGANHAGRQLAAGHVMFNLLTGVLALLLLPWLLLLTEWLATWLQLPPDSDTLRLALFHSLFNFLGVVLMTPAIGPLAQLLQKWLPEQAGHSKRARFLNEAALASATSAISVSQQETQRLYRFSRDVIIQALGWRAHDFRLHHSLINDEQSTDIELQHQHLQQGYQHRLKPVYGDIVEFVVRARARAGNGEDEQLRRIRVAGFHLLEAIKGVKHLLDNLTHYLHHGPVAMTANYHALRTQIAATLTLFDQTLELKDSQDIELQLQRQHLQLQRFNDDIDMQLEQLIQQQQISSVMATSLMTDKSYCLHACKRLLTSAEYLLLTPQLDNPDWSLNDDDYRQLARQPLQGDQP